MNIYVIKHDQPGLFKVGISNNPKRRLLEIQNTNKRAKHISLSLPSLNARKTERLVHNILKPFRVRMRGSGGTEWFDIRPFAALIASFSTAFFLYIDAFYYNFAFSVFAALFIYFCAVRFVLYFVYVIIFVLSYYKFISIILFLYFIFLKIFI